MKNLRQWYRQPPARLAVYTLTWNEEKFLPHFLDHYHPLAERLVVYDNDSTDRTRSIVEQYRQAHGRVELRRIDTGGEFREDMHKEFKDNAWKECRETEIDYVIVVDADELIYHPDLRQFLGSHRQYSLFSCQGFEMVGATGPQPGPIRDQYHLGSRSHFMNKPAIFCPNRIEEIDYRPGAHRCDPVGEVTHFGPADELRLLHHKYLGFDYVMSRHRQYQARLSEQNIANGWGEHHSYPAKKIRKNLADLTSRAEQVYERPDGLKDLDPG